MSNEDINRIKRLANKISAIVKKDEDIGYFDMSVSKNKDYIGMCAYGKDFNGPLFTIYGNKNLKFKITEDKP